jgi:hypothetical protein
MGGVRASVLEALAQGRSAEGADKTMAVRRAAPGSMLQRGGVYLKVVTSAVLGGRPRCSDVTRRERFWHNEIECAENAQPH